MAIHQYIGARYVPKFYENSLDPTSTLWESNVEYEALTIVTALNGHSYISKKTVPDTVGSPADNAEYWLDTGSESGYIHDLQEQVDEIISTLGGYDDSISALQDKDTEIEGNITDLQNADTDLQNELELVSGIARPNYVAFIGDSFCDPGLGGYDNGVASVVRSILDLDTDHFILRASGGAGLIQAGSSGKNFEDYTDDIIDAYPTAKFSDFVFQTAANDSFDTAVNVSNAKLRIADKIHLQYPHARVWWAYCDGNKDVTARMRKQNVVLVALFNRTARPFVHFIDARSPMYLTQCHSDTVTDTTHPNTEGVLGIGQIIAHALLGRDIAYFNCSPTNTQATFTPDSNVTTGATGFRMFSQVSNGSITISFGRNTIIFGSAVSFNGNNKYIKLGSVTNCAIPNALATSFADVTADNSLVIHTGVCCLTGTPGSTPTTTKFYDAQINLVNNNGTVDVYLYIERPQTQTCNYLTIAPVSVTNPCCY